MLWDTDRAGCYQSKVLWQYGFSLVDSDLFPIKSVTHMMGLAGTNKGAQDGDFGTVKNRILDVIMATVGNCITSGIIATPLLFLPCVANLSSKQTTNKNKKKVNFRGGKTFETFF